MLEFTDKIAPATVTSGPEGIVTQLILMILTVEISEVHQCPEAYCLTLFSACKYLRPEIRLLVINHMGNIV